MKEKDSPVYLSQKKKGRKDKGEIVFTPRSTKIGKKGQENARTKKKVGNHFVSTRLREKGGRRGKREKINCLACHDRREGEGGKGEQIFKKKKGELAFARNGSRRKRKRKKGERSRGNPGKRKKGGEKEKKETA